MKLLIKNVLRSPLTLSSHTSKYSPQHTDLKHPQSVFLGQIVVLYILIFTFLGIRWENKRIGLEC